VNSKLIGETGSRVAVGEMERSWVLVFAPGEEVIGGLEEFARRQGLTAARFTAIGAFKDAVLGFFDRERKDYHRIPIAEQVEVLALTGNIARLDQAPKVHAHVVLGKRDGTAHGGHLLEAHVRPTLEVMMVEAPRGLQRRYDPAAGLALIATD
jgi:uncharacterized protein